MVLAVTTLIPITRGGLSVGCTVGLNFLAVGRGVVGKVEGVDEGKAVGSGDGASDGSGVGSKVGSDVGAPVGSSVEEGASSCTASSVH